MKVGDKFWHCKRINKDNAEIQRYELPKEYTTRFGYITIQPAGSIYRELATYGENVKDYRVAIAQPYNKWKDVFSKGDRAYLDGRIPTEEDSKDESAENANYEVEDAVPQNLAIRIVFKRRVAE